MITPTTKPKINKRYQTISNILNRIPNYIGIEIGVWSADLSTYLLENHDIKKFYLIDPWKKYPEEYYIDSLNKCTQENYESVYAVAKEKMRKYLDRSKIFRGEAEDLKNNFEDNNVDFIYLDANNLYDEVFKNITSWFPKLKKGGILIGNNFIEDGYYVWLKDSYGNPTCFGEYSVKSAVRVFCKKNNLNVYTPGENQWYIIKE